MKRKILSIFVMLAMMMTLVPSMSFTAFAEEQEEYSEQIEHHYDGTGTSEHFNFTANNAEDGWLWGLRKESPIIIEAKSNNVIISHIEILITFGGIFYNDVIYSSGEKAEPGRVVDGNIVKVGNINSSRLEITSKNSNNVAINRIIVYFTTHTHDDKGSAKSNLDGTHSYQCSICGNYGDSFKHEFSDVYKDNEDGTHSIVCTECGERGDITESHVFTNKASSKKATDATCTKATTYYVQCDKCEVVSDSEVVEVGDLLPHTWDKGKITVAPTDDEDGVKTYTCSECGQTKEEKIPKTEESEESSEVIAFNEQADAESEHFTLHAFNGQDSSGWIVEDNPSGSITITTKNSAYKIKRIDAVVGWNGNRYSDVVYSSGTKVETGGVAKGTTVHVTDINSEQLTISCELMYIQFKDITVYYTHSHDFTGTYQDNGDGTHSRKCLFCDKYSEAEGHTLTDYYMDNGDGTHSFKCTDCNVYGEAVEHTYEKGICTACGAHDPNWTDLTDGKAYAQKDSDTAIMRFMWKIETTEETNITNIGAYVIPFDKFDDIATDSRTKSVQYVNPTTADGQALKSGNTFAVDVTNIPTAKYDTMIWALPFVNGSVIANQLLNATVNDADINK